MASALMTTRRKIMTIGHVVRGGVLRKPVTAVPRAIVPVVRGGVALKRQIVAILIRIVPVVRGVAARRNKWELGGSC
jgi:hypothetical protein